MIETIGKTKKGNYVVGLQKDDQSFLDNVDQLFDGRDEDAFVLGQYPVLSTGVLSLVDYSCFCPPEGALAVSKRCYEITGPEDKGLGWAVAADYLYRLKERGFTCGTAFDFQAPSFKEYPEEITELWLDGLLLDYKHGTKELRRNVVRRLWEALTSYDISIGNYSRKTVLLKMPYICRTFVKCGVKGRGHNAEGFDFLRNLSLRGSFRRPELKEKPLVSVIIRTHKRPATLRKTLELLRKQTYKNFEIVLIEDGEPAAEQMLHDEFKDLTVNYNATGRPIGRSAAANLGFSLAKGKYLNLLDDDDYLFPEHLETAVSVAEDKEVDVVFLQDLSLSINKINDDPYEFDVKEMHFMNFPRIDPFTMSHLCATPDNGVFFRKEVLNYAIGMREDLDANEDWSLWLRMLTKASYAVVRYATCCFVVPHDSKEKEDRIQKYSVYNGMQLKDELLKYETSGDQMHDYYVGVLNDFNALTAKGQLDDHLKHEIEYWNVADPNEFIYLAEEFRDKAEKKEAGTYSAEDFVHYYLGMIAQKYKETAKRG